MKIPAKYISHYKSILKLGIPIMLGQIGIIVVGFADNIMVGHYSTDALAASSLVINMFNLPLMLSIGFSIGLTPIIATFYAQGDIKSTGESVKNGLFLNIIFSAMLVACMGIMYFFLDKLGQPDELMPLIRTYYLINLASVVFVSITNAIRQFFDGCGSVKTSMWILLAGNVVNIIFNYFLIFGKYGFPEMGLAGAGISTLFARVLMTIMFFIVFMRVPKFSQYYEAAKSSSINKIMSTKIFKTSWPVSLQIGLETLSFTMSGIMVGWLGTIQLASYQIIVVISTLGFIIYNSYGASICIKISHYIGKNDFDAIKYAIKCGYHIMLALTVIASLIFYFLGRDIISFFTTDPLVIATCIALLPPLILYQFADSTQITFANGLRGLSYVKPLIPIAAFAYMIVGISSTYTFGFIFDWKEVGIMYSFSICLFIAACLYRYFFFRRLTIISEK